MIYKTNFSTEAAGEEALIAKGVLGVVVDEGVVSTQYINGTQAVVNIGKVIDQSKTTDPENPIFYDGWAYDIMSTDTLDFGSNEVYPGDESVHSFAGYPRNAEVPE